MSTNTPQEIAARIQCALPEIGVNDLADVMQIFQEAIVAERAATIPNNTNELDGNQALPRATSQELAAKVYADAKAVAHCAHGYPTGTAITHMIAAEIERERAVQADLLAALEEAIKDCRCSLRERESGHLVDCFAPNAIEAIRRAREGQ
jgi:hypothetical protein